MTEAILDPAVLEELEASVGAEFLAELVQTFLEEAPAMIETMSASAASEDADGLRRAAHSLKSNANTFGLAALAEVAKRIELEGAGAAPEETLAHQLLELELHRKQGEIFMSFASLCASF